MQQQDAAAGRGRRGQKAHAAHPPSARRLVARPLALPQKNPGLPPLACRWASPRLGASRTPPPSQSAPPPPRRPAPLTPAPGVSRKMSPSPPPPRRVSGHSFTLFMSCGAGCASRPAGRPLAATYTWAKQQRCQLSAAAAADRLHGAELRSAAFAAGSSAHLLARRAPEPCQQHACRSLPRLKGAHLSLPCSLLCSYHRHRLPEGLCGPVQLQHHVPGLCAPLV